MSQLLDKLEECLLSLGVTERDRQNNTLSFKMRPPQTPTTKIPIFVEEDIEGQARIYTHYLPPPEWEHYTPEIKRKVVELLMNFNRRNSRGVYFKIDELTGDIYIEGYLFYTEDKLSRVFVHCCVLLARQWGQLESDLLFLSQED